MSAKGVVTLGDLVGRIDRLEVRCRRPKACGPRRCPRHGGLRLARLVTDICAGCELADARSVLTEVLVSLPVYRAYVNLGEPPPDETTAV